MERIIETVSLTPGEIRERKFNKITNAMNNLKCKYVNQYGSLIGAVVVPYKTEYDYKSLKCIFSWEIVKEPIRFILCA